jgi:hypothetical protein
MSNFTFTIRRAAAVAAPTILGLALAVGPTASQAAKEKKSSDAPRVVTGVAHGFGASVTLTGTIKTHGLLTTYKFEYGPASATGGQPNPYEKQTTTATLSGDDTAMEKVSRTVTDMLPGYHYRLVASNEADPTSPIAGKDRTYTLTTKRTKSGFELPSSFEPTPVDGEFVLSGTLTGSDNSAREVVLQESPYPYTAAFVDVGSPALTGATGAFSLRVARLTESTRFRVATAVAPLLFSDTVTQLAQARVTLKVRRSKRVEGLVRLYGTVSPAEAGAHVFLQLEQPPKAKPIKTEKPEKSTHTSEREPQPRFQTKFTTIVKRAGKTFSRFSIVVSVSESGNYRAFLDIPAGPLAPGASQTVILHAPPSTKKHKKA